MDRSGFSLCSVKQSGLCLGISKQSTTAGDSRFQKKVPSQNSDQNNIKNYEKCQKLKKLSRFLKSSNFAQLCIYRNYGDQLQGCPVTGPVPDASPRSREPLIFCGCRTFFDMSRFFYKIVKKLV